MQKSSSNQSNSKMNIKYDFKLVEHNQYNQWMQDKIFSTHDNKKPAYSIILPPPNITGKLHLGHALNGYLQDTMIRFKKLQGFDTLFVPSMDHAGIATQVKIEQELNQAHLNPQQLTTQQLLAKAQTWKTQHQTIIQQQWAKLGLGLDYHYQRFTLDDELNKVVTDVFIQMYQQGLIYKGQRAINWDPTLGTAISNMEVVNKPQASKMYYFKYYLVSNNTTDSNNYLSVATTRPETMYSDVALAINPQHPKLKQYIGKVALNPLTNKPLPIISDSNILIKKGSGVMKVSAHAALDIDIINQHNLDIIECIDSQGKMNHQAQEFTGLDRFKARALIIEKLKHQHHLIKQESINSSVSYSERSNTVIEILVKPQWFVKIKPLATKVLQDLKSNHGVKFYPPKFSNILIKWMENAHDWTISRQLWWGHKIPAWYKGDEIKVQVKSPGPDWTPDNDVLDTWFSSALAPFSFLDWPNQTKLFKRYFPTDLLVTGYDIIFFWVSRMYFQSLNLAHQKPFKSVLIHGLIRAEDGQKMSKSLGNGIDPMEMIDKYGSDALRWFLLTNTTPGQDLTFSTQKMESAWNLGNKIWNIGRYILTAMPRNKVTTLSLADEWILIKLKTCKQYVTKQLDKYQFTLIGKKITHFIQEEFSSWYIELSKSLPNYEVASYVLTQLLIMLQPFWPFLSNYIFKLSSKVDILTQTWEANLPNFQLSKTNPKANLDQVIEIIQQLRHFRTQHQLNSKTILIYWTEKTLLPQEITMVNQLTKSALSPNNDLLIPLKDNNLFIQTNSEFKTQEIKQLQSKLTWLNNEITRSKSLLTNSQFIKKAPADKVKLEQTKFQEFKNELIVIKLRLKNLQKN